MKLSDHQSQSATKLLLIGDSGSGKTGALASLAKAGYNLYIADFDNGVDILRDLLKDDAAALARVDYHTLTDKFEMRGPAAVPVTATAWSRFTGLLSNWPDKGNVATWGEKDVLVIDSLTFLGNACMRYCLSLSNRLAALPGFKDWQQPQQLLEQLLALLYAEQVRCNIVVISHIVEIGHEVTVEKDGKVIKETLPGSERGYAAVLGKALSPKIGRYFNSCLLARSVPYGTTVARRLFTDSQGIIELKSSAPRTVKKEYSIDTGLAEYFAAVRGVKS